MGECMVDGSNGVWECMDRSVSVGGVYGVREFMECGSNGVWECIWCGCEKSRKNLNRV